MTTTMRRLLVTVALTLAMTASAMADFTDRELYNCDKDDVETELTELVENSVAGKFGMKLLYVRDAIEVPRKPNELRWRISFVTSRGTQSGIFRFFSQDGHNLVGFKPNAKK
jgi:hypothetical protein